ncbi:MAG: hypothetical protein HGB22_05795 [Chlorobiaceae bacterium]|nr:hypothetical protein [Chlorobiaceae bacterium]
MEFSWSLCLSGVYCFAGVWLTGCLMVLQLSQSQRLLGNRFIEGNEKEIYSRRVGFIPDSNLQAGMQETEFRLRALLCQGEEKKYKQLDYVKRIRI